MPLFFPDDHKPDLSMPHLVELKCLDSGTKRVVRVMVPDIVIEAHAIAAGWKEPLGEYDRSKMVYDVLDRVVAAASKTYDAQGKPAVFELDKP
jgi:hypothetical protein